MKEIEKNLYFVTGNIHKFNEILEIFNKSNLNQKCSLFQSKIEPIEIQSESLKKIAKYKVESVLSQLNASCFVEDAGLFVDKPLKGFPGVYSAYVLKTIGNEGILKMIENKSESIAHFESVIALYFKSTDEIKFFEGRVDGKIAEKMRGKFGFGFDPIFIPNKFPNKTFSEIPIEEKNKISHRSQAFTKLAIFLNENL